MAVWRSTYVSKKTGEVRRYEYHYDYYETAEQRALVCLHKRPLRRVPGKYKWTAGLRGPVFHDATIIKLIKAGKAVCFGDFVELKGAKR